MTDTKSDTRYFRGYPDGAATRGGNEQ